MIARNLSFDDEIDSEDSISPFSGTDQRKSTRESILVITYTSLVSEAVRCLEKMSSPPFSAIGRFIFMLSWKHK